MHLVDTCGWIEWLVDGKLGQTFHNYINKTDQLIVPAIIQYELYKWVCRERDENLALSVVAITEQATVMPIDTHVAITAAEYSKLHHLAMADAFIYACAQISGVDLITCDSHFKGLPNVSYHEK